MAAYVMLSIIACRGRGGRGGAQVPSWNASTRRGQAQRWQGGEEGKINAAARRGSRAQRRMDRAEAKCAFRSPCTIVKRCWCRGWISPRVACVATSETGIASSLLAVQHK